MMYYNALVNIYIYVAKDAKKSEIISTIFTILTFLQRSESNNETQIFDKFHM